AKDYPFLPLAQSAVQLKPFKKKLKFCRVAVVTGAALYLREKQEPFNVNAVEGDCTFRALPRNIFADDVEICHEYVAARYAKQGINTVFPSERLRRLEEEEVVGELNDRNYSINDFIPRADRVEAVLAMSLTEALLQDEVDVALFIAASELGHQTMA